MITPFQTCPTSPQHWVVGLLIGGAVAGLSPAVASAAVGPSPGAIASGATVLAQAVTVIERDSSGELVTELQRRLTQLGFYDGPITGFFGELTESAVIRFQQSQGLLGDGVVGASTADALRSGTANTSSTGPLQLGDEGPRVSQLQQRLVDWGVYSGPVDGAFGERTEAAVMRFQTSRGLAVDGIVGGATESALDQPSSSPSSAAQPSSDEGSAEQARTPDPTDGLLERSEVGEAVTDLQHRLTALNYYNGPIDGSYGPLTEAAVSKFQTDNNLTVDGVTGPATLAAINSSRTAANAPAQSNPTPATAATAQPAPEPARAATPDTASNGSTDDPALEAVPIQPASAIVPTATAVVLPVRVELSPEDVRLIQARLQDRGFYDGPVDGILNDATRAAIATAQQAYEISPSDLVFTE
ncbi:MAG: peptidoglycan-binding protein [Elainellaceae cyanobacterium]